MSKNLIYFLRHGDAENVTTDDAARALTAKGERQAIAAGRALGAMGAVGHEPGLLGGGRPPHRRPGEAAQGGLAIVDGSTLLALLRPGDLSGLAERSAG